MKACIPRVSSCSARSQPEQVVHPVLEGLDVPVEHRRVGADPQRVRDAVHLQVLVGRRLVVRDARANLGVEDLGSPTGQTVEARVA
jgi:hypothetical protein